MNREMASLGRKEGHSRVFPFVTPSQSSGRISTLLSSSWPVFSFEFFPPKTSAGERSLFEAIEDLRSFCPGFVSVTYGAGGSTKEKTSDTVEQIQRETGLTAMPHLTCVGSTKEEISATLDHLVGRGVQNVLALRGDPPKSEDGKFHPAPGGFSHACELVAFIREQGYPLSVGVAGYPEKHPEAPDVESDLANQVRKVQAGGEFVITQLFFDTAQYFRFVARLRACGVRVPVIPGILPVTNYAQILKFATLCGATIPAALGRQLDLAGEDATTVQRIGVAWAIRQCRELLAKGAPGIHFYTLNKSEAVCEVLSAVHPHLGSATARAVAGMSR